MIDGRLVLIDGAVLTALSTAFVVGTVLWKPRIWLQDFPPDIRAAVPPKTPEERRLTALLAAPWFLLLFGGLLATALRFGPEQGYLWTALHVYLVWQTFNVFDWLVIDWGGMHVVDPQRPPFPGTEGFAGWRDYRFHFVGFLKGSVMGLGVAAVMAALALLLR